MSAYDAASRDGIQSAVADRANAFLSAVYTWMSAGLRLMALQTPEGPSSSAIVGALALYLDFTNLFLFLLRFSGNRRDWN